MKQFFAKVKRLWRTQPLFSVGMALALLLVEALLGGMAPDAGAQKTRAAAVAAALR